MLSCYSKCMVFRRASNNSEPNTFAREVVDALEKTKLDPETTLVMGGSALALAGIRRASDLDLVVPYFATYRNLQASRRLPNGSPLQDKVGALRPFLETVPMYVPQDTLAVDVTHPHDDKHHRPNQELDQEFLRTITSFEHVHGYPVMPLDLVLDHKLHRTGMPSRKDRQDIRAIRQHLQLKDRG